MFADIITSRLSMRPDPAAIILVFFIYSFVGYIVECLVLSAQYKRLVIDRGFVIHLPFCIIYGFGAMVGYALLQPLADTWLILFVVGAIGATVFEFAVARLQIFIFGDFWWDYTEKPLNYKGILCLESTLGWGLAAWLVVKVLHRFLVHMVSLIPEMLRAPLATLLVVAYVGDFIISARVAARRKQENLQVKREVQTESDKISLDKN